MVKLSGKPGEPRGPFRITIDGKSSEKQILPSTQAGFTSLKTFYLPHSNNDYYKKITYDEIFKAVKEQIQEGEYNNLPSSLKYVLYKSLPSIDEVKANDDLLISVLEFCVTNYSNFFESDLPKARALIAEFGRLVNRSFYAQIPEERQMAKEALEKILSRPEQAQDSKKFIPPYLYLNGMYVYLDKITKYLETQYKNHFGNEPLDISKLNHEDLSELRKADPRLIEIVKNEYINILIKPKGHITLTKKLMADFFEHTPGGLNEKLKEEKHLLKSPEKAPAYLIYKHQKQ